MSVHKYILIVGLTLFCLGIFLLFQYMRFADNKLHVVICDVGQGDGIYIRTPQGFDIIIDGGPDRRILDCLGGHMPLWDREIDVVFLTHPHADHVDGLIDIFNRYRVKAFATEKLTNKTGGFKALMQAVQQEGIKTRYVYAGDRISIPDGVVFRIVAPTRRFLEETSPGGVIGERAEFASLLVLLDYKEFQVLITGDSQAQEIEEVFQRIGNIDVMQVPHHGSKTGLTQEILTRIKPNFAFISVGKNNKYNHPSPEILALLSDNRIPILRTDLLGSIHISSNGMEWVIE